MIGHHALSKLLDRLVRGSALRQLAETDFHQVRAGCLTHKRHVGVEIGSALSRDLPRGCCGVLHSNRRIRGGHLTAWSGDRDTASGTYLVTDLGGHAEVTLEHRQTCGDDLARFGRASRAPHALEGGHILLMMSDHGGHVSAVELRT